VSYPIAGRDEIARVVPSIATRFPTNASFGASTIDDIFPKADVASATRLEAHTFASAVALNNGRGGFTMMPLPIQAQFAPIHAAIAGDFDGDGRTDLLIAGNFFAVPPVQGQYDASYGLLLHGLGDGRFKAIDMLHSGIEIPGQVRRMRSVRTSEGPVIAVARNDDRMLMLQSRLAARSAPLATLPRTSPSLDRP
jgi:hypothetical protein